jgi:low affinity Fe/Cu permease
MNAAFTEFSTAVANAMGKPITFVLALAIVVIWAVTGPFFGFSDVWQLVINTSTTIITFLMIFVLQNTQNRDNEALQAKLDELILTSRAHNKFVGIEHLEEKQLNALRDLVEKLAAEGDENAEELTSRLEKQSKQIEAMNFSAAG